MKYVHSAGIIHRLVHSGLQFRILFAIVPRQKIKTVKLLYLLSVVFIKNTFPPFMTQSHPLPSPINLHSSLIFFIRVEISMCGETALIGSALRWRYLFTKEILVGRMILYEMTFLLFQRLEALQHRRQRRLWTQNFRLRPGAAYWNWDDWVKILLA
jgi:hypothetical protein